VLESNLNNERTLREKIEQIEKKLRNIFESTSAGLFQLDHQGKILTHNPTFMKFLVSDESKTSDLIGNDFGESFLDNPSLFKDMIDAAIHTKNLISNDLALRMREGKEGQNWLHCLLSRVDDPSGQALLEGVIFDISSRIAKEKAIRYQAEYDALTGILRRDSIERNLTESLLDPKQWPLVIMLMDLDGFKAVNDNYGHDAGDEVLVEVTQRFKNNIRSTDVVGRLGGDEFVIILNKCEPINAELTIAKKIIESIQKPIVLKSKQSINIGVSIGIASNTIPSSTAETLMKAADDAMYMVKRHGKNSFAVNKGEEGITVELTQA
jgi:diguanylate cyclase (GGDEF)-like protein/PAS domain S-box-containing protein